MFRHIDPLRTDVVVLESMHVNIKFSVPLSVI